MEVMRGSKHVRRVLGSYTLLAVAASLGLVACEATSPEDSVVSLSTASPDDIVLHPVDATVRVGSWQVVSDASAARGQRLYQPNAGVPRTDAAVASPAHYFELSFTAPAGVPFRLWMRGKGEGDSGANDSVWVQFSDSIDAAGQPAFRIGTTSGTMVNIEDCAGCGLSGWGWQDNGLGVGALGPTIRFASSGTHRVRVQAREDGTSFDHLVLSPTTFLSTSPGAVVNDTTILDRVDATEIVLWAAQAPVRAGTWAPRSDASAAGGASLYQPDAAVPRVASPVASPGHYFEMTFPADAGRPYRLWMRGKADANSGANDSVFVQFCDSVDANGAAIDRIGTTSGEMVNLEDCAGCGISGWGWQDNGLGVGVLGPLVYFQTSGLHTIRVQAREDGFAIDQIVLSASRYASSSPGALRNDTTLLARAPSSAAPANLPPRVSISATPSTGTAPVTVAFTAAATDDDGTIAAYAWTFGDGGTSTAANPSHAYTTAGSYAARVTVTDDDGDTATATHTITVQTSSASVDVRVVQMNISYGCTTHVSPPRDGGGCIPTSQVEFLATQNPLPDLVSANEAFDNVRGDGANGMKRLLEARTGQAWYRFADASGRGNVIFSRTPFVRAEEYSMVNNGQYPRSILGVTVNVRGKTVSFFSTHLDHTASNSTSTIRIAQVKELKTWIANRAFAEPRIVAGDFNSIWTNTESAVMRDHSLDAPGAFVDSWADGVARGRASSYPGNPVDLTNRTRRTRLDYVYASAAATQLSLRAIRNPDTRDYSTNASMVGKLLDPYGCPSYAGGDFRYPEDCFVRPSDH